MLKPGIEEEEEEGESYCSTQGPLSVTTSRPRKGKKGGGGGGGSFNRTQHSGQKSRMPSQTERGLGYYTERLYNVLRDAAHASNT